MNCRFRSVLYTRALPCGDLAPQRIPARTTDSASTVRRTRDQIRCPKSVAESVPSTSHAASFSPGRARPFGGQRARAERCMHVTTAHLLAFHHSCRYPPLTRRPRKMRLSGSHVTRLRAAGDERARPESGRAASRCLTALRKSRRNGSWRKREKCAQAGTSLGAKQYAMHTASQK